MSPTVGGRKNELLIVLAVWMKGLLIYYCGYVFYEAARRVRWTTLLLLWHPSSSDVLMLRIFENVSTPHVYRHYIYVMDIYFIVLTPFIVNVHHIPFHWHSCHATRPMTEFPVTYFPLLPSHFPFLSPVPFPVTFLFPVPSQLPFFPTSLSHLRTIYSISQPHNCHLHVNDHFLSVRFQFVMI